MANNRLKTYILTGGEDFVTPALEIPDGMAKAAFNYEQNYDTGFTRINGYRKLVNVTTPGIGPILGVVIFNDDIYIFRNKLDETAGMWKATPAEYDDSVQPPTVTSNGSWTEITDIVDSSGNPTLLQPNGYYQFVIHNFKATTGTTTTPAGSHDISGDAGNLYGVDGINPAFEFNGTQLKQINSTYVPDVPMHIEANGNRLALGFRAGEIALSALGDPFDFNPVNGAGSIGVTDFHTGMMAGPDGVLYIFCKDKIYLFKGMNGDLSKATLSKHNKNVGSFPYTQQMLGESALFYDTLGVTSLDTSQNFGDVITSSISNRVQSLLIGKQAQASIILKNKAQYRLFFQESVGGSSKTTCLIATLIRGENIGFTHCDYPFSLTTITSDEINGIEYSIAGDSDGNVYHMDKGNSFDGAAYTSYLTLPFSYLGSPHRVKKFRKIMLNIEAVNKVDIKGTALFSFGQSEHPKENIEDTVEPKGAQWGAGVWGDFVWGGGYGDYVDMYVNGHGDNISLTVISNSSTDSPHTIKDITYIYQYQRIPH